MKTHLLVITIISLTFGLIVSCTGKSLVELEKFKDCDELANYLNTAAVERENEKREGDPQNSQPTAPGDITTEQENGDNGLEEGDIVVTNGNFKIDSEMQLRAKPSMMNSDGSMTMSEHQHSNH